VYPITVNNTTPRTGACRAQKDDTYSRVIPALHPDLIVVMEVAHEDRTLPQFLGPNLAKPKHATPAYWQWVDETTKRSVSALRANGRKVLMVEPIPVAPSDPLTCLSKAKVLEECRYIADDNAEIVEHDYRQIASNVDRAWSLDLDHLVCPYIPICDPVVGNQIVKLDTSHLTATFSKSLAPSIDAYLKDNGLIPR
jgi:hypothetical protein